MNYYNPFGSMLPYAAAPTSTAGKGLFSSLLGGGIKWGNIINYTQKTLGIINQGIPIVKQMSPVVRNMKTMFKVMNEFKRVDTPNLRSENKTNNQYASDTSNNQIKSNNKTTVEDNGYYLNNGPVFFV